VMLERGSAVALSSDSELRAQNPVNEQSRHLIDSEILDMLQTFPTVTLSSDSLEAWRTSHPLAESGPDMGVDLSVHSAEGPEGAPDVEVRVYRPSQLAPKAGCIFHIHGGGFISGDAASLEQADRTMSHDLHCIVATVNYRLAPETSFPGNIEDCYAALSWLFRCAPQLGVDCNRIGLLGRSAGGGLAAALALLVRDRGRFHLAFQHLIYPMLDDRTCVLHDPNPFTGEFIWTRQNNHFGWSALLGRAPGLDGISPYAAPARAPVLEGLPATFISTATLDLFLEEDIEYARRLMRAGVPTELHVYPGAFHGFDLHPTAKISCAARRDSLAALARLLRTS
jgi:acetyl esterase/lipase